MGGLSSYYMLLEPCEKESVSAFHAHMQNGLWGSPHSCGFACAVPWSVSRARYPIPGMSSTLGSSWERENPSKLLPVLWSTCMTVFWSLAAVLQQLWQAIQANKHYPFFSLDILSDQSWSEAVPLPWSESSDNLWGALGDVEVTVYPPAKSVATIKSQDAESVPRAGLTSATGQNTNIRATLRTPVFCRSALFLLFSAMERKSRDMSSLRNKPFSCTVGTESFCILLTQRSSETGDSQVWKPSSNGMVQLLDLWGVCHCWGTGREERLSVFLAPAHGQLGFWLHVRKVRKTEKSTCLQKGEPQVSSACLAAPHFQAPSP